MEGFFVATDAQKAEISTFQFPKATSTSGYGVFGGGDFSGFVSNPATRSDNDTRRALKEVLFSEQEQFWQDLYDSSSISVRIPAKSGMNLTFPTAKLESMYNSISSSIQSNLFRFDGSDLMPPLVNSEWWRLMTEFGSYVPESTQPSLWRDKVSTRMRSFYTEHNQKYDVCLQYNGNGRGDFSFNDMAYIGYEVFESLIHLNDT